uniref:Transcription repressor n=1 Tax=Tanacetum cinerariifolium TaxID=118510 RepID=A0A6L2JE85_TANCI|nr:transcription repressor OFP7-like [Tanacetum cinerariifolium]
MIPCKVEGKMKESFAIVKGSKDPYDDFKKSMMEMIMEKQMFKEHDLKQLLQCFVSLNSRSAPPLSFRIDPIISFKSSGNYAKSQACVEATLILTDFDFRSGVTAYEVVMVDMGECGEGSRVHWWRRVEKVVVG